MQASDSQSFKEVAACLNRGGIVVLPTETVYGLAIKPGLEKLLERAYKLKGRPPIMNLPVVIGALEQVSGLGVHFNEPAVALAAQFWPGPLTIVMGFSNEVSRPSWLAGRLEVALRFPKYELLQKVALTIGPFLLTSANAHGAGPKSSLAEALDSLHGTVDLAIDAGTLSSTPSTIVNTRLIPPLIERVGVIPSTAVADVVNDVMIEDMETSDA